MAAARPNSMQKLIILGDTGTGKTSLMQRFVNDKYSKHYKATIGADFLTRNVQVGDRMINLQIWDTAGQERFQSLGVAFYRGSDACAIVYDVTNNKSFRSLSNWKREFLKSASPSDPETFPFIVLGNKIDTDPERHMVREAKVQQWCDENGGIPHFLVSAKDGTNVAQAFLEVATRASKRVKEEEVYIPDTLDLKDSDKPDDNGCPC